MRSAIRGWHLGCGRRGKGCPQLVCGIGVREAGGHDADHRVRPAVDRRRVPDDCSVAAEPPLPERIRKDYARLASGRELVGGKRAPQRWPDAKRLEEIGRDDLAYHQLGIAVPGEGEPGADMTGQRIERCGTRAPILEIERAGTDLTDACLSIDGEEDEQ